MGCCGFPRHPIRVSKKPKWMSHQYESSIVPYPGSRTSFVWIELHPSIFNESIPHSAKVSASTDLSRGCKCRIAQYQHEFQIKQLESWGKRNVHTYM